MTGLHPWHLTQSALLQIRLLDWAFDQRAAEPSRPHMLHAFDAGALDRDSVEQAARDLASFDLVHLDKRAAGVVGFKLKQAGMQDVEARRLRRQDCTRRRQSSRDALLFWLAQQPPDPSTSLHRVSGLLGSTVGTYEGEPFTQAELDQATTYLQNKGLIDGPAYAEIDGLEFAQLTAHGVDCVEDGGSVAAWVRRTERPAGGPTTIVQGDVHGPVATAGRDVSQSQQVAVLEQRLLAMLSDQAQAVRQAATAIDSPDRAGLISYVDAMEAEAQSDDPDVGIVRSVGEKATRLAARLPDHTVAALVGVFVGSATRALGMA